MTGFEPHVATAIGASGARIVITGASGWIGMATLNLLNAVLGPELPGRVQCFGSNPRTLALSDGTSIEQRALADLATLAQAPTIVLHFAFLTKDRAETMDETAYRLANGALSRTLLDALDLIGAEAIFVASSGAAGRASDPQASPAMRLYGTLKLEQEDMFVRWAEQRGKRAVIARIFNISGPHINKQDSYALATFINDALGGRPISIRASHRVIRSYVAVRELMSLVFAMLLDGKREVGRFESGGEPMEMQQIAETVANHFGTIPVTRPPLMPTTDDHYAGDDRRYRALLAEYRIKPVPFERQVIETIDFMASSPASSLGRRVVSAPSP